MDKRILKWKPIPGKNIRMEDCDFAFPDILDSASKWTLLEGILRMEPKNPISFEKAATLAMTKYRAAMNADEIGYKPGQCLWYAKYFLEWISSMDFHIEITGEEFELHDIGVPKA